MRPLTNKRTTTTAIADALGIRYPTIVSWAIRWHGPVGSGNPHELTVIDRLVARAWQVLYQTGRGGGNTYGGRVLLALPARVEVAIRSSPRAWLLIAGNTIETFDTIEDAGRAWLERGASAGPAALLIDLWSVPS